MASRRIATANTTSSATLAYVANFIVGSTVWACPATGRWRFALWGSGGGGGAGVGGGGGGSLVQAVRFLKAGQTVTISIADGAGIDANGLSSTATFPDGSVITAGGGLSGTNGGTGGVATGGDINTSGANKITTAGGIGASYGALTGGSGASPAHAPAQGGFDAGGTGTAAAAGLGLVLRET